MSSRPFQAVDAGKRNMSNDSTVKSMNEGEREKKRRGRRLSREREKRQRREAGAGGRWKERGAWGEGAGLWALGLGRYDHAPRPS